MLTRWSSSIVRTVVHNQRKAPAVASLLQDTAFQLRSHGDSSAPGAKEISLTFIDKNEQPTTVPARVGQSILQVAHKNGIDLEGACEASIACSTCHVILDPDIFDQLEPASEDEDDMLDMAFGLTETSRLGCQVHVTEEMDGTEIVLPKATRNFYVDGHVPQPH